MVNKRHLKQQQETDPLRLLPWLNQAINQSEAKLQVKLRGNVLHVLCETPASTQRESISLNLVKSLLNEEFKLLLANDYPQIYQLYLYNRLPGQHKPEWTAPIYLNRLERHLAQLVLQRPDDTEAASLLVSLTTLQAKSEAASDSSLGVDAEGDINSAIVLSNLSLARQGDPDAIARYLSETLSALDVGVWVNCKARPGKVRRQAGVITAGERTAPSADSAPEGHQENKTIPRLWIFCEAAYSPDPQLIAEPTAQRLRALKLARFQDAVMLIQVQGEPTPDWGLRIDLTPPEEMLRDWARWGDQPALQRLINQALADQGLEAAIELKESTLHVVSYRQQASEDSAVPDSSTVPDSSELEDSSEPEGDSQAIASDQTVVAAALAPLLETLAPQGIHRAMLYGQQEVQAAPAWVMCLDLPAAEHPALAESTASLAAQGDLLALAFLLNRLLNPDLDLQLATGGVRIQLLVKDDLLHIMVDGPICPGRRQVAQVINQFLDQMPVPDISGVRVYGRRAGQQRPTWSYGIDFHPRERLVPEATPEFAASDAYLGDLLSPVDEEAVLRPELTPKDLQTTFANIRQQAVEAIQQVLIQTQLFVPQTGTPNLPLPLPPQIAAGSAKVALIWGAVGLLMAVQMDWLLGQILNPPQNAATAEAIMPPPPSATVKGPDDNGREDDDWAALNFGQSDLEADPETIFDQASFTQTNSDLRTSEVLSRGEPGQSGPRRQPISTEALLEASPYPSFRSEQLDEKLALYHQRLIESGPPDILIVGSSRALRGIDPAVLKQGLAALGYKNVSIFNFGVNGSTAQIVDLTIRRILRVEQLPQLILWADGARALNSGRVDVTYNAIAVSDGYRELRQGKLNPDSNSSGDADENAFTGLTSSYQAADRWMSENLAQVSAAYGDRDRLKHLIGAGMALLLPEAPFGLGTVVNAVDNGAVDQPDTLEQNTNLIDFDGFLSLSVRFNPATYYQFHAKVAGDYDGDYEDFKLEGLQDKAFKRLFRYTQSKQIPIVFINTPLTDKYLDPYRMEAEQIFQKYMLRLSATEAGFVFRDLGQVWPERYDFFSDPSHLNRYGAYRVSNRLVQDPMIPWPKPQLD
ncbi:MAG: hypothetical protein MJA27_32240 [Pseudanabaenales cyanobacterium]|nr:hypothetical protein [Pseudanabaenales cyanobacterium]